MTQTIADRAVSERAQTRLTAAHDEPSVTRADLTTSDANVARASQDVTAAHW